MVHLEKNRWLRALIVLAVFAVALYLGGQVWGVIQHYSDIIITFFLAWLLAFILSPLASNLQRSYRISRAIAASLVYLFMFVNVALVFVLVVPLAAEQLVQLGQRLPGYFQDAQAWGQGWLDYLQYELRLRGVQLDLASLPANTDIATQVGSLGSGIVANTISVVGGVASVLTALILILVLSFYLVLDGDTIVQSIFGLVPARYQIEGQVFLASINRTFGGWLRGTLLISLLYGVGNAVVMAIVGLNYVALASVLAVLLVIFPLVGPVLAMVMPVALAAFSGDLTKLVLTIIGLLVLQVLVYNVLSPKVLGESIGLHPLLVLFALLIGLKQAGLIGAIFGVPVVGVLYAMFIYVVRKRQERASREVEVETAEVVSPMPPPNDASAKRPRSGPIGAAVWERVRTLLGGVIGWFRRTSRLGGRSRVL
jgi:predicted PurR-regulated permease PerM